MSKRRTISLLFVVLMLAFVVGASLALGSPSLAARSDADAASPQASVGSGFTYQGRLTDGGGSPINDTCSLDFTLWDAESGGSVVGHQLVTGVEVNDGYLAVLLNSSDQFGADAFTGEARWLKIGVKCSADAGWITLPGRQLLSAVPYALSLRPGAVVSGTVAGKNALSVVNYGTGNALGGYSRDADGVHGQSVDGAGVSAFSFNSIAVYAESRYNTAGFFTSTHGFGVGANTFSDDPQVAAVEAMNQGAGPGVVGFSNDDTGVYGNSTNGHGVEGFSVNEVGVYGQSENTAGFFTSTHSVGVHGSTLSDNPQDAAVEGVNLGAGPGVEGLSSDNTGVYGESTNGHGVEGASVNEVGVYGRSENTAGYFTSTHSIGVHANTTSDDPDTAAVVGVNLGAGPGVVGFSTDQYGVYGNSTNGHGVAGFSANEIGVYGESINTAGFFTSTQGIGVHGTTLSDDPQDAAVEGVNLGAGPGVIGFSSDNTGVHGVSIDGPAATFTSTHGAGILVEGAGAEGLRILDAVGLDYIWAGSDVDAKFKVSNIGDVFADGSYNCGLGPGAEPGTCVVQNSPADFAEMLPARRGLEPGDVLVIGLDGRLARSTQAYQSTVVGVYSSQPGYLGSGQHRGQEGYVPLAVVGVVPVKASAENGVIHPGDLLVASATPGYAMKAGANPPLGAVIGKALEGLDADSGVILILAMLQ